MPTGMVPATQEQLSVAYSDGTLRPWIREQLQQRCGDIRSVVDVGAGAGQVRDFFAPAFPAARWIAIEIWAPYLGMFKLRERYDEVVLGDVRRIDLPPADLYIFGDVLEHMGVADALAVWDKARQVARWLVINLPVVPCPQGPINGNPHEAHLVHWDMASVRASFAGIVAESGLRRYLCSGTVVGAFIATGKDGEMS